MKNKLTKAELIENIHEKLGLPRGDIHRLIDEIFEEIKGGLMNDQIIELRGFGTFYVKQRKGREKSRNPKTGESVSVDDHCVALFRPGKELKDELWDKRS